MPQHLREKGKTYTKRKEVVSSLIEALGGRNPQEDLAGKEGIM